MLILVIGGGFSLPKIDLAKFDPFAGFGGNGGADDKVAVQKEKMNLKYGFKLRTLRTDIEFIRV